jgi:hypothetical protein
MSYSATDTESIAARCLLLGPLLRKVSTAACDWMDSGMQGGPVDELKEISPDAVDVSSIDEAKRIASVAEEERRIIEAERRRLGLDA